MSVGTNNDGLSIRRSETSDDAELADLFNRAHAHLAGTVVRSASDIAWRCRRQPGMPDDGGILVEDPDGRTVGYAFVKSNGDVTEFAVDPDGPRLATASALVTACEERALSTGATRVRVNIPVTDEAVASILEAAGWVALRPQGGRYVASTDPGKLVGSLAAQTAMSARPITIVLSDPLAWQHEVTSVAGGTGLQILAGQRTLNEILLGGASPWKAVASRRLRIKPLVRTVSGVRYLKAVRVDAPWFHTLGDVL